MEKENFGYLLIPSVVMFILSYLFFQSLYSAFEATILVALSYFVLKSLWKKEDETTLLVISVLIILVVEPLSQGSLMKNIISSFSGNPIDIFRFFVLFIYSVGMIFIVGGILSIVISLYRYWKEEKVKEMKENTKKILDSVSNAVESSKDKKEDEHKENIQRGIYHYQGTSYLDVLTPRIIQGIKLKFGEDRNKLIPLKTIILLENLNKLNVLLSQITEKPFNKCKIDRGDKQ